MPTGNRISGSRAGISQQLRWRSLLFACLIIAAAFQYGSIRYGIALLEKYEPDWTMLGWVKLSASAIAALCIFIAFRSPQQPVRALNTSDREGRFVAFATAVSGSVLFLSSLVVLVAPQVLNELVREGQFLSIATEFVLLGALAYFALCVSISRNTNGFRAFGLSPSLILLGMFSVTFLILMEEMSWGQHWLGWEAGDLFAGNAQNETNLHNFSTYKFEAAYYSAAFICFVALPYFWSQPNNALLRSLTPFIPRRSFAIASLPIAGLLFEAWNIIPYQVWFFLAVIIALSMSFMAAREGGPIYRRGSAMLILLVVSQAIFLAFGSGMVDGYELSEIREFLIALVLACYSVTIYIRLRNAVPTKAASV